jgi:ketosteroid isomerase-like protein
VDQGREVTNGDRTVPFAANCGGENSVAMISKEEVQAFYEKFLEELKSEDTSSLERIYADDYILVRPNGDTFTKEQILADLRHHSMRFTSFDVNDVLIRTKGSVGILTADVRSIAVRDGVEIRTHARQLAILSKENERITISHFQSTNVVDR